MDSLSVLQDAIDRTQTALGHYTDPHPGILEVRTEDMLTGGSQTGYGWINGALQRYLLDIADDHRPCDLGSCRTCDAIAESLILSLEALRWMHRQELENRVAAPAPKTVWWRLNERDRNL